MTVRSHIGNFHKVRSIPNEQARTKMSAWPRENFVLSSPVPSLGSSEVFAAREKDKKKDPKGKWRMQSTRTTCCVSWI